MLKNVLSLLLSRFYSKQESEAVGHQAMPTIDDTVTLNLTVGGNSTYIAPTDGYFNVEVGSSGYVNCWGGLLCSASNGIWNKVAFPAKKGQTINYRIEGTVNYAAFVKLVGWGGSQLLRNLFCKEVAYA